jgi:hypothetical protein
LRMRAAATAPYRLATWRLRFPSSRADLFRLCLCLRHHLSCRPGILDCSTPCWTGWATAGRRRSILGWYRRPEDRQHLLRWSRPPTWTTTGRTAATTSNDAG